MALNIDVAVHMHNLFTMGPGDVATFNVGGTLFSTIQSTLGNGSMKLLTMALGVEGFGPRDAQKLPFIDTDPTLFAHVMYWLRRGALPAGLSEATLKVCVF